MAAVAVFGSAVLDLVFAPARLPAPGETALSRAYRPLPGGKGANQALACARAGARTSFTGVVGQDAFADMALANLRDEGVDLAGVRRDANLPTACACVCVAPSGENMIVVGAGANEAARAAHLRQSEADGLPPSVRVLVMQSEVPLEENERAALLARSGSGPPITLWNAAPGPDPAGDAPGLLTSILLLTDHLVVNEREAVAMYAAVLKGTRLDAPPPVDWANKALERDGDDAAPENARTRPHLALDALYDALALNGKAEWAACSLARRFGCVVCVTLGEAGASVYTPAMLNRDAGFHVKAYELTDPPPPPPKRMHADPPQLPRGTAVVDTVGAGDAFVGAYAAAFALGMGLKDALRIATVAGTLACTRTGAQASPSSDAIRAVLDASNRPVTTEVLDSKA